MGTARPQQDEQSSLNSCRGSCLSFAIYPSTRGQGSSGYHLDKRIVKKMFGHEVCLPFKHMLFLANVFVYRYASPEQFEAIVSWAEKNPNSIDKILDKYEDLSSEWRFAFWRLVITHSLAEAIEKISCLYKIVFDATDKGHVIMTNNGLSCKLTQLSRVKPLVENLELWMKKKYNNSGFERCFQEYYIYQMYVLEFVKDGYKFGFVYHPTAHNFRPPTQLIQIVEGTKRNRPPTNQKMHLEYLFINDEIYASLRDPRKADVKKAILEAVKNNTIPSIAMLIT
jgi:hypothetical protein